MDNIQTLTEQLYKLETLLVGQKTVLNLEGLADYTGYSKSYLYKLTSSGGVPFYRPKGKQIFFNKKEIDSWLLSNKVSSRAEIAQKANDYLARTGGK